ncbi:uncharacterized protein LOC122628947 isoform X1 [Vespula pensylvanica]|uniref:uncharacterized protein LOC122628947 isoform X1 n=1 Tax=Vespula pensylvanica TaxID=30213 RepID=UPI001CB9E0BE|nr:uncharacterized protein LOC122628947 isoform X1 [Vespula pensylvanica]XP_043667792.1 uncharacterized protein LOC122628947 isoform X1 [Vespula pensylvanica]XP_043667793.1 uncharacterized protein LOC122628947 isoform X1 [Vespula pensylvanica]XP_043667794.1 uncharacterized protein LOC122628947 isoform X1 [Vespula pensylvanica]
MALVMLPCDLPWWPAVVKQLDRAALAKNSTDLLDAMQRLHDMCNISLDPEEDIQDPELFTGLAKFLDEDLDSIEREQVFKKTIPRMVERAKSLRSTKPPQGLHYSLQQQGDSVEYSYAFVSSLIANAFFSTYPKRTTKTHPTLRDFNFTNFFKHLHTNCQKAKLKSIFHYYDYLENEGALDGRVIISRQVMTSKQWLTIEDWLESNVPLCPLTIRHEGRLGRQETETVYVCFASARFGGGVLDGDVTQETIHLATHPEMIAAILSVEALEDNEALIVENVRRISIINDPHNRAIFEAVPKPNTVTICCIDPEDYSRLPLTQFEEDNILREMNKSLLGFRQRHVPSSPTDPIKTELDADGSLGARRLSPIGESFSSTPPEIENENKFYEIGDATKDVETTTFGELSKSPSGTELRTKPNGKFVRSASPRRVCKDSSCMNKKNRFIVLGSSGEVLPVTRKSLGQMSVYSSCNSQSTDSFHSAKDTMDEEVDEEEQKLTRRYSSQLDTPERRGTFAQRLKEALKRESTATGASTSNTSSGESSYAVGISIAGSHVCDQDIKLKRGGSRGFVLRDETVDEDFLKESLEAEQKWLGRFRQSQPPAFQRRETNASSRYSFSTEYNSDFCSELEEVYEQLSKWLEDPIAEDENRELDARDRAVVRFAGSLLKRALSESFAGVPVQEGEPQPFIDSTDINQRHKLALAVRSLSLELARQKSRRQQSVSESEEIEYYEDALSDEATITKDTKDFQRRKLRAVAFTSEVYQTLVDDHTTVYLPKSIDRKISGTDDNISGSTCVNNTTHGNPIEKSIQCLVNEIPRENSSNIGGLLSVATGNWGCGSRLRGDPQLKLVIQWLAASLAGVPRLIYYTAGNCSLSKLDTISRVLLDRHWSVGDLAAAVLKFSVQAIEKRVENKSNLFEELIGTDKLSP